jgi:hypothetical protein
MAPIQIGARFVEKDQAAHIDAAQPVPEPNCYCRLANRFMSSPNASATARLR